MGDKSSHLVSRTSQSLLCHSVGRDWHWLLNNETVSPEVDAPLGELWGWGGV
jgi:hypothetical protein